MGILDIFKKKKETKKKKPVSQTEKIVTPEKAEKISPRQSLEGQESFKKRSSAKEKKLIFGILKKPHITEKASALNSENQYVFEVNPQANKIQIKKAVESFYNVGVEKVRIINIPARPRRLGRTLGKKSGFKKAIVTLKKGDKIELMPH